MGTEFPWDRLEQSDPEAPVPTVASVQASSFRGEGELRPLEVGGNFEKVPGSKQPLRLKTRSPFSNAPEEKYT